MSFCRSDTACGENGGRTVDFAMLRTSLEKLAFLYHMCRDDGDFFVQNG